MQISNASYSCYWQHIASISWPLRKIWKYNVLFQRKKLDFGETLVFVVQELLCNITHEQSIRSDLPECKTKSRIANYDQREYISYPSCPRGGGEAGICGVWGPSTSVGAVVLISGSDRDSPFGGWKLLFEAWWFPRWGSFMRSAFKKVLISSMLMN